MNLFHLRFESSPAQLDNLNLVLGLPEPLFNFKKISIDKSSKGVQIKTALAVTNM